MELVTSDKILETIKDWVANKHPISPELWLEASAKLNILAGDDEGILAEKEFELAQLRHKLALSDQKRSVAAINIEIRANPLSKEISLLKAKLGRIDEFIRIAKLQARMTNDAINHQ